MNNQAADIATFAGNGGTSAKEGQARIQLLILSTDWSATRILVTVIEANVILKVIQNLLYILLLQGLCYEGFVIQLNTLVSAKEKEKKLVNTGH